MTGIAAAAWRESRHRLPQGARSKVAALALFGLALVDPAALAAQQAKPGAGPDWGRRAAAAVFMDLVPIEEVEPNNTAATATPATLGSAVTGVISPAGDIDFFSFDAAAGDRVELEVVAWRAGSSLDPWLYLYSPDGTLLTENDDAIGLDSRIQVTLAAGGRYHAAVRDYSHGGGAGYFYTLNIRRFEPAPGDPSSIVVTQLGSPWTAASGAGVVYVADVGLGRLLRVQGSTVTPLATNTNMAFLSMAVDGYGNLLVTSKDQQGREGVDSYTPGGVRSEFVTGLASAAAVTVGPDGDVWVADPAAGRLRRYSPDGQPRATVSVSGLPTLMGLGFSPAGDLYYSDFSTSIYRIRDGAASVVLSSATGIGGFAFDRDGWLYVGTPWDGILLYDPNFQLVNSPFAADGMEMTPGVVFLRDETGGMTNRLVGVNLNAGTLREVNRNAVRAPGHRIGADLLSVATTSLRGAVMGAAYADTLKVEGFTGAVSWSITAGALPPGLIIGATGIISGVPEASGNFTLTVRAEGGGRVGTRPVVLQVTRPVVNVAQAADHLLGATGLLSADVLRFLDLQGNRNGRFDLGDLVRYTREPAPATEPQP